MTNTCRKTLCHVFFFFFFFCNSSYVKRPDDTGIKQPPKYPFPRRRQERKWSLFFRHNGKGEEPGDEAAILCLGGILCLKVAFYHLISVNLKAYSLFSFLM